MFEEDKTSNVKHSTIDKDTSKKIDSKSSKHRDNESNSYVGCLVFVAIGIFIIFCLWCDITVLNIIGFIALVVIWNLLF